MYTLRARRLRLFRWSSLSWLARSQWHRVMCGWEKIKGRLYCREIGRQIHKGPLSYQNTCSESFCVMKLNHIPLSWPNSQMPSGSIRFPPNGPLSIMQDLRKSFSSWESRNTGICLICSRIIMTLKIENSLFQKLFRLSMVKFWAKSRKQSMHQQGRTSVPGGIDYLTFFNSILTIKSNSLLTNN